LEVRSWNPVNEVMTRTTRNLTVLLSACFLWLAASGGQAADRRPNVILIVSDDQHREQANFLPAGRDENGRPKNLTPNIDRLAREGVVLRGLHCPSPLCVPSRFTCLTGNYASRATNRWMMDLQKMHGHTFIHQEPNVVPKTPTLAKDLKALGYVTGAVGKNHAIEAPGYEKVDARESLEDPQVQARLRDNQRVCIEAYQKAGFDFAGRIYHTNPRVIGPPEIQVHNLDWINEAGLDFIDRHGDRPFFLYYAVTVPHGPYHGYQADPRATPLGILPEVPRGLPPRESIAKRLAENGYSEERGDMLWLDDCVGSLLAKLEQCGQLDNTIILYLCDHGVEGGKTTCYHGGMLTFGFVWGPPAYVRGGRVDSSPCSIVDLAPTINELCGGTPSGDRYDGVSLKPLLAGKKPAGPRVLYGEMGHTRAVVKGRWKYIALRYSDYHKNLPKSERLAWLDAANEYQRSNRWQTFEANDPDGPFGHSGFIPDLWDHEKVAFGSYPHFFDPDQLYDLQSDPREQHNLADDPRYKQVLEDLKQELRKFLAPLPGGFAEFKSSPACPLPMAERIGVGRELMKTVFH
jgi:arylsulfatase A-like enzyme